MAKSFKVPESAQNNAKKVLDWKKEHGDDVKGMTSVGWAMARKIANSTELSLKDVKKIAGFARFKKDYDKARSKQKQENKPPWKYAAITAWLGWGGDTLIDWAGKISQANKSKAMYQPLAYKAGNTSAMICFFLHPDHAHELAITGGQPWNELHLTLAYLGEAKDVDNTSRLLSFIEGFALTQYPIRGRINGVGRFVGTDDDNDPAILLYDSPQLPQFRQRLIEGLKAIGITPSEKHGFIPHITLEYIDPGSPVPYTVSPDPMAFYSINVVLGDSRFEFPLTGENYMAYRSAPTGLNIIESIIGLEGQDTEILALYARPDGQFYANVRGLVSQATIDAIKMVLPGMVEIKAETEPDGNGWTQIWPGMVGKAGARNSRMDKGRIQKAHDLLCELGAECKKPEAHPTKPNPIKVPRQNYKSLIQLSEALTKAK